MQSWKERVEPPIVTKAREAISPLGIAVASVCFDFTNCLVRIGVTEDVDDDARDALVASVRKEVGVGAYCADPPVYPFDVHLQRPRTPIVPSELKDGVLPFHIRASDLARLRAVFTDLGKRCSEASTVATFALGGLVPLQFIARLDRANFVSDEDFLVALSALQAKYHLFPGLLWTDDGSNARLFQEWLSSIGAVEHLLVFDTTFSGGAVGRIQNVVTEWATSAMGPVPQKLTIVGVVDEGRLKDAVVTNSERELETAAGCKLTITTEYLRASSLIAEDVNELVGYDALRAAGGIDATWTSAVVYIEGDDGTTLDVIGTRTLPATFADMLDGRHRVAPLDKEFAAATAAFGVLMCIREAARHERDKLSRARSAGLLTDQDLRSEFDRVKRAEEGALKRYKQYFDAL